MKIYIRAKNLTEQSSFIFKYINGGGNRFDGLEGTTY